MSMLSGWFKVFIMILWCCVITSCAVQKLSLDQTQSMNKIAILSELDNHMNKVMVGLTIFDDQSSQSSVKVWNINNGIENDIAQKLWEKGKEVVVLQTTTMDIMQEKKKLLTKHESFKGAQLVIIVRPIYQAVEYPMFPEGYGLFEKNALRMKHRLLYASIIYEVYSTKDGSRKAYYIVHPEGSCVLKLDTDTPFDKIVDSHMLDLKSKVYTLFDHLNTTALKEMGLI